MAYRRQSQRQNGRQKAILTPNYLQKAIVQEKLSRKGNSKGEIVPARIRTLMARLAGKIGF